MEKIYKVASLFSGCGGGDLGILGDFTFLNNYYSRLHTDIVFANDNNVAAARTYARNFGNHISTADIRDVATDDVENHDILLAGFPCQPFSMVGMRKGLDDHRGQLYREVTRFLLAKSPAAFVGENVKGLTHWAKGKALEMIIADYESAGYNVRYKVLNAADYGVPQKRERVFIVGIHKSLNRRFSFPTPTHSIDGTGNTQQWVPLGSVISSLLPENSNYYFSEKAVEGLKKANKAFNKGRAQSLDKPCNTINSHLAKVSLNGTDPVLLIDAEKELYRRFTPREAASIQSFPDSFAFAGGDLDAYRQIGNAIAPVLMWHVAKSLLEQLEATEVSRESQKLVQLSMI